MDKLNKILELSFINALQVGFNDDCPLERYGIMPWDDGCEKVCEDTMNKSYKCWQKYFMDKSTKEIYGE